MLAALNAKGRFVISDEMFNSLAETVTQANLAVQGRQYADAQRLARTALSVFSLGELRQVTALTPRDIVNRFADRPEAQPLVARALYICARGLMTSSNPAAPHLTALMLERATLLDPRSERMAAEFAVHTFGLNHTSQLLLGFDRKQLFLIRGAALRALENSLSVVHGIESREVKRCSFAEEPHSVPFPKDINAPEAVLLMGKAAIVALGAANICLDCRESRLQDAFEEDGMAFLRQFLLAHDLEFNWRQATVTLRRLIAETPDLTRELSGEFPQIFDTLGDYYGALSQTFKKEGKADFADEFNSYRAECRAAADSLRRPRQK